MAYGFDASFSGSGSGRVTSSGNPSSAPSSSGSAAASSGRAGGLVNTGSQNPTTTATTSRTTSKTSAGSTRTTLTTLTTAQTTAQTNQTTQTTIDIPLTTIFTPPAQCSDVPFTYSTHVSGLSTFWRPTVFSACYPSGFPFQTAGNTVLYSAGVCPSGYHAASSATNSQSQAAMSWCCPSGMSYAQDYGCFTTVSTPTTAMMNATATMTMTTPFVAADYYIQVAWASDQLNLFTPRSAPILGSLYSATIATPTATGNSTNPGMTTEQIAGMSIGLPVAVAVIALACYTIWRRKRRSSGHQILGDLPDDPNSSPSSGMTEYKRSDSTQVSSPETNMPHNMQPQTFGPPANIPEPPAPSQRQQQRFSFGVQNQQSVEQQQQQQQPWFWSLQDRQSVDETQPAVMPR